jgi:hypothetical protein
MVLFTIQPQHKADYKPVTVLELFTSQGCSSCPPADDLLKQVKQEHADDVIVLSYHVDYWNYIGWKDIFSKKVFSDKQRIYGRKFSSRSIYTPQVVVNGKEHFGGSNRSIMHSKLKHYSKHNSENIIDLSSIKKHPHTVSFNYDIKGDIAKKRMRIVLVVDQRETHVKRGENRNRVLSNSNIVVEEAYVDIKGTTGKTSISIPELVSEDDKLSLVTLIENDALDIVAGSQIYL